jgi:hypothetical protein
MIVFMFGSADTKPWFGCQSWLSAAARGAADKSRSVSILMD